MSPRVTYQEAVAHLNTILDRDIDTLRSHIEKILLRRRPKSLNEIEDQITSRDAATRSKDVLVIQAGDTEGRTKAVYTLEKAKPTIGLKGYLTDPVFVFEMLVRHKLQDLESFKKLLSCVKRRNQELDVKIASTKSLLEKSATIQELTSEHLEKMKEAPVVRTRKLAENLLDLKSNMHVATKHDLEIVLKSVTALGNNRIFRNLFDKLLSAFSRRGNKFVEFSEEEFPFVELLIDRNIVLKASNQCAIKMVDFTL